MQNDPLSECYIIDGVTCKQHFNVSGHPGGAKLKSIVLGVFKKKSYVSLYLYVLILGCSCCPFVLLVICISLNSFYSHLSL